MHYITSTYIHQEHTVVWPMLIDIIWPHLSAYCSCAWYIQFCAFNLFCTYYHYIPLLLLKTQLHFILLASSEISNTTFLHIWIPCPYPAASWSHSIWLCKWIMIISGTSKCMQHALWVWLRAVFLTMTIWSSYVGSAPHFCFQIL